MSAYAYDLTAAEFQEKALDASMHVPVVIDFWAEWCAPCKVLKPLLERLAEEYGGRFLLAKVDSDAEPELAAHFGIRSLPTVAVLVNGQVADGFTGAKAEGQVREFLDRFVSPAAATPALSAAEQLEQARQARATGDAASAAQMLELVLAEQPDNVDATLLLAEIQIEHEQLDAAEALLTPLLQQPDSNDANDIRDARLVTLHERLTLIRRHAGIDSGALAARLAAEPDNHALRLELADALAGKQDWRGALEQLLSSVKKDKSWNEAAARKAMLKLFELLASDELQQPLVREYRSKLAATLN